AERGRLGAERLEPDEPGFADRPDLLPLRDVLAQDLLAFSDGRLDLSPPLLEAAADLILDGPADIDQLPGELLGDRAPGVGECGPQELGGFADRARFPRRGSA